MRVLDMSCIGVDGSSKMGRHYPEAKVRLKNKHTRSSLDQTSDG